MALLAPLAMAGCGGGSLLGGNSSPFGSASSAELQFVAASQTWDLDKNGVVTCDEWKHYAASEHKAADGNGDASLDATEWSKLGQSDRLFETVGLAYFDGNGDGRVGVDEMTGRQNVAFKMLDKNSDCQIGLDEKATVYSNVKPKSKDTGGGGPGGPAGPGPKL
jgi:Ca2+-binding EF-hand superfamily protein